MSLRACPKCGSPAKPDENFCQHCGAEIIFTGKVTRGAGAAINYRGYVQIIGTLEVVFGILGLILGAFVGIFAAFIPGLTESGAFDSSDSSLTDAGPFLAVLLGFMALLIIIFAIASMMSGIKLMQYKHSGRIGTMIISGLSLFFVPIGTAFGIVALYVLTRPDVEQIFS